MKFFRMFSTKHHADWWKNRQINWEKEYLSTWNHPHRWFLAHKLRQLVWGSLFEFGVGAGANIYFLAQTFPRAALGGIDVSPAAIEAARKALPSGIFRVGSADPLLMSDKACDIMLTDMTLIYVGPRKIEQYLSEFTRVSRGYIVLIEFYHRSWWKRLRMTVAGRYTHNYPKLLEKLGCYDIVIEKVPKDLYPGANDHEYRHIIIARTSTT